MAIRKRETKNGTVYDVMYRDATGKQLSAKVPTGVEPKLYEQQLLAGMVKRDGIYTVREMVEDFLRIYKTQVKITSYKKYEDCGNVMLTFIGDLRVDTIKPAQVQEWIIDWSAERSVQTVSQFYFGLLQRAAEMATNHELIRENIFAKKYQWPKNETEEESVGIALTKEQAKQYIELAEADSTEMGVFAMVALHTAMRRGEILAMRGEYLDADNLKYDCRHTLTQSGATHSPKTKSSQAMVPLNQIVVDALATLPNKNGRLFTFSPRQILDRNKKIRAAMNLPELRVHDLRHTCASLMCLAGVPIAVVSRQLRHASVSMTWDIYAHLYPQQEHDGVVKMVEVLG